MRRFGWCIIAIMAVLSLSCSPSWNAYSDSMFHGKRLLRDEEYPQARDAFLKAAEAQGWPSAYAFAATASYKMGDLQSAMRYIQEAERLDGRDFSYLRTVGYKALILLKEGRTKEGIEVLEYYAQMLRSISSPKGARQVEVVMKQQPIDLARLEALIDEQVSQYESDIAQYWETGTGFYDRSRFRPGPAIIP